VIPESVIATARLRSRGGICTGRDWRADERGYLNRCTHFHWATGTVVMFTRDTGHHSSGWMKNPDYERCWHLSLSFREPRPERDPEELANAHRIALLMRHVGAHFEPVPFDHRVARAWVEAFYGDDRRYCWEEGPFSGEGKALGVRHYRLFCDPTWKPILPRREVYTRDFTEKGWRSWSEVQGEDAAPNWVDAS